MFLRAGRMPGRILHAVTADDILRRASRLTPNELRALAKKTNRLAGWLGTRRAWVEAMSAAVAAANGSGRRERLAEKSGDVTEAIFLSVVAVAPTLGSPIALHEALQHWNAAVDRDDERARRRQFRLLQRRLVRTLGFRAAGHVGPAMMGTTAAVVATLTWDLTSEEGPFDAPARDLLIQPWHQAIG